MHARFTALRTGLALVSAMVVFLAAGRAGSVGAAESGESAWAQDTYSKARLVSGAVEEGGTEERLAGVQIRMSPGWKTYWRTPGDSGVPPSFNWSGSKNLKSAEVLYPVPHRFADAGGTAIGYSDEVVFPVKVKAEKDDEPVLLKLNLSYGVCKTLCVPSDEALTLELPPGQGEKGEHLLIQRYLDLVPAPAEKGTLPAIGTVEAKLDATRPELLIDTQFPDGAVSIDLFAEAPDDAFVPVPKPVGDPEGGKQRFAISFGSQAELDAIKGKPLTLTLVWDGGGRQTTYTIE